MHATMTRICASTTYHLGHSFTSCMSPTRDAGARTVIQLPGASQSTDAKAEQEFEHLQTDSKLSKDNRLMERKVFGKLMADGVW